MSDRQLDIEVALFVMGQKYAGPCPLGAEDCPGVYGPHNAARTPCLQRYSTDICAAWLVVEHFRRQDMLVMVGVAMDLKGRARGYYALVGDADGGHRAEAETAPLAICRAALAAVRAAKGERHG